MSAIKIPQNSVATQVAPANCFGQFKGLPCAGDCAFYKLNSRQVPTGFADAGKLSLAGNDPQNWDEGQAQRSAYIGDVLYGISRCRITSADIDDPSVSLDTIKLYTGDWCDQYGSGNGTGIDWEEGWDGSDIDVDIDGDADIDGGAATGGEVTPDDPEWDTESVDPKDPSDI